MDCVLATHRLTDQKKETGMANIRKAPARTVQQDATQILIADHKKVSKIFAEFEKVKDKDGARKQALVKMACDELTVHAQVEEEIFYPALYEAFKEKDDALVDEAEVEHGSIKQLIATLQDSDPDDRLYDANVTVLSEYVKHHVKEEQDEIFPKARKSKALDLKQIGEEISSRKAQLMEEYGIVPEETAPATKRQGSAQRHA
jgi:hemerythrin superfamily protein